MLQFDPPVRLPAEAAAALGSRLQRVTLQMLTRKGCQQFAFIKPGERLPGFACPDGSVSAADDAPYPPRFGAFCYIFGGLDDGDNCYFPIGAMA